MGKIIFKIDGMHIKRYSFEFPTLEISAQSLVIEAVPFSYLASGKRVFNNDKVYKIVITDCDRYLTENAPASFGPAYAINESAICDLINAYYPLLQCVWEMHQD